MNDLDTRIQVALIKRPDAPNYLIAKNLHTQVAEVQRVRDKLDTPPSASEPAASLQTSGGISLKGLTVSLRKPAESAASFIRRLPKDQGFIPSDLTRQWGIAENTIKRHAKDLNCLRFVETSEGEWSAMVMHPETAAKHSM